MDFVEVSVFASIKIESRFWLVGCGEKLATEKMLVRALSLSQSNCHTGPGIVRILQSDTIALE